MDDESDYYKHFHLSHASKGYKEQQEIHNIYQKPKKDKGQHSTIFYNFQKNYTHQVDVLYLPEDEGYKYLLVVVDVATRLCDAEPLKHVSPDECLKAIKTIYDRNIVNIPKQLISDSGVEFQGSFSKYFRDHHVFQRTALPGRHRQVGLVERRNQDIGKALHMSMVSRELLTAETNKEWIHAYRDVINKLNDKYGHPEDTDESLFKKFGDPLQTKQTLLQMGDRVRVQLDEPRDIDGNKLHGKFRDSDIRFGTNIYKIIDIHLTPHQPPLYIINKPLKANQHVTYTKNQLQLVKDDEKEPPASVLRKEPKQYTIKKLLDKRVVGKKTEYLVNWRGFKDGHTWETSSNIPKHFITAFEKN